MQKITRILTVVVTCLCIGYFSGLVIRESVEIWFPTLVKPSFTPPNWVFAPVWSTLYIMMGVAAGLVWNRMETDKGNVRKGLLFFAIQLALNFLWSYLFFGLHNPLVALVELMLLWLMIYETYLQFKKIDKIAGMLLLPYLGWVAFAGILNASIFWLNR
nr:TspO/MBR family protein [uncultured Flavobacterium sp.]